MVEEGIEDIMKETAIGGDSTRKRIVDKDIGGESSIGRLSGKVAKDRPSTPN